MSGPTGSQTQKAKKKKSLNANVTRTNYGRNFIISPTVAGGCRSGCSRSKMTTITHLKPMTGGRTAWRERGILNLTLGHALFAKGKLSNIC